MALVSAAEVNRRLARLRHGVSQTYLLMVVHNRTQQTRFSHLANILQLDQTHFLIGARAVTYG